MVAAAMPDAHAAVDDFVTKLRRRQVEGSLNTAKQTAELLRLVVSNQRLPNVGQAAVLIDVVKTTGLRMIAANPIELAIGNIVRRVLHIIREEDVSLTSPVVPGVTVESDDDESDAKSSYSASAVAAANRSALRAPSLHNLLESIPEPVIAPEAPAASVADSEARSRSGDRNSVSWKLKHNVIEGITELLQDIENYHSQVAEQAIEHIHQNEVILTLGRSRSLLKFLLEAKKKRSFQVVIAEGAPKYQGHILAKELAKETLQTTVITDSAVFAMISRVNMVIVGAHAVMANGGVLAPVGMHMVALAARRHAVPFVVLAGVHKLCPQYPHNPYTLLNDMKSPAEIVDFGELSDCLDVSTGGHSTYVVNPTFDYIPPELVSLFITDTGGHNPSYVYRLIAEYYSPEDYVLQ
jgi:translation initiation factor eIF-2B subunit beta